MDPDDRESPVKVLDASPIPTSLKKTGSIQMLEDTESPSVARFEAVPEALPARAATIAATETTAYYRTPGVSLPKLKLLERTSKMIDHAVKCIDSEKAFNAANLDMHLMGIRSATLTRKKRVLRKH